MATLTATRGNPVLHACYHRLLTRGKAHNVAMTAARRKFLTILNAMGKRERRGSQGIPRAGSRNHLAESAARRARGSRRNGLQSQALRARAQLRWARARKASRRGAAMDHFPDGVT
jgi:hypothetical protein